MQEYKICTFCGKAVQAEMDHCRFCGGLLQFEKPVCVSAARAAVINNPESGVIKPVARITESAIFTTCCLSLMTAALYAMGVYTQLAGFTDTAMRGLLLVVLMGCLTGTWISFGFLLKKFNGAEDIARPLINMNFYFIATFIMVSLIGFIIVSYGEGTALFVLVLCLTLTFIAGTALFIISAARMINAPNDFMQLPLLGKLIIASIGVHFVIKMFQRFAGPQGIALYAVETAGLIICVMPYVYLALLLARSRKKILSYEIEKP